MRTQIQLIPIHETGDKKTVSARELHQFLGLAKSQWKRWYMSNILNNPFAIEGEDYRVFDIVSETSGGRPTQDFEITIRFAKKISMATNTAKGEIAKEYFLQCEEVALEVLTPAHQLGMGVSLAAQIDKIALEQKKAIRRIYKRLSKVEQPHPVNPLSYFKHKITANKLRALAPEALITDDELAMLFHVNGEIYLFCKTARESGLQFVRKGDEYFYEAGDVRKLLAEYNGFVKSSKLINK